MMVNALIMSAVVAGTVVVTAPETESVLPIKIFDGYYSVPLRSDSDERRTKGAETQPKPKGSGRGKTSPVKPSGWYNFVGRTKYV
jgi:hypothetical protein